MLLVDLLQVPVDGGFRMPRRIGHVAHAIAFRQPDRHLSLRWRQFQGRGHQVGIDAMRAPRLDNQHQRGHVPRSVVRLRAAHRLDVHHERRHHGRAAERHRPTDSDRARGWQRVAHQPFETDLVGRRTGAQHPVPVQQPIAVPQEAPGAVVPLQDPPAPVQFEDADPRVVEQGGHGRAPRPGADQRLPDADELLDMGQQPLDPRDPRSPPALRVDGIVQAPADVGAVQPGETEVLSS